MTDNIKDKVIVITGASSGMGEAAARHLAQKGARVVLAARRSDRIDAVANEINELGGSAIAMATDVTLEEDVKALVDAAVKQWGRIDVLINNAGVMPLSTLDQAKVSEWNQMIDVNLRGVLHGIAAALPYMKAQKSGQIINTASVAAHLVFPASAVYSATKYAVRALTEGLRKEASEYNVRATLISPGAVSTELLDHISDKDVQSANQAYVGKVGIPAETFARMVAFAINEPEDVGVNEIIFRPTAQDL
ncbi:NADP-dependent 3-hydroxy acid dehydrogenase YdfG [Pantoea sp. AN62]|uniref:Enzyme n=1 Tax=Pantoea brenneri TaxID=472694 RepID=A0AAX3JBN3_9GAMM|nr:MULTISPECIES: SDR family oxidoreductase [Pantoea]KKD31494.1 oxidoreductase [Pantoea sp. 3.5.1]MBS6033891.1 SDR family oxidoreductase [Pantoea sp.]MCQ5471202.1 SDR family oxidoreductase [Pantoea brenneri]MDH2124416.1 SDR family oxidoreductase [Pantoea brenneri]MDU4747999.1 SDR family oxidoreductase [Pantoea sp.]